MSRSTLLSSLRLWSWNKSQGGNRTGKSAFTCPGINKRAATLKFPELDASLEDHAPLADHWLRTSFEVALLNFCCSINYSFFCINSSIWRLSSVNCVILESVCCMFQWYFCLSSYVMFPHWFPLLICMIQWFFCSIYCFKFVSSISMFFLTS